MSVLHSKHWRRLDLLLTTYSWVDRRWLCLDAHRDLEAKSASRSLDAPIHGKSRIVEPATGCDDYPIFFHVWCTLAFMIERKTVVLRCKIKSTYTRNNWYKKAWRTVSIALEKFFKLKRHLCLKNKEVFKIVLHLRYIHLLIILSHPKTEGKMNKKKCFELHVLIFWCFTAGGA